MLTPVDIQQKKFHTGIGYDKKDVNTFFESVAESYEQLYRSNAELKEKVISLTDGLQNYKSKEDALQKSLMLAEKDSEDTKSNANREAKVIISDAKNKAKVILNDAEERLQQIQDEVTKLETQYAAYKSSFATLLKMQFAFLKEKDFDVDAYIDPNFAGMFGGGAAPRPAGGGASFGEFTDDPQMRDESPLGGAGGGFGSMSPENMTSSSAMYGSSLSVDPFDPTRQKGPGRYNPYDGASNNKKKNAAGNVDSGSSTTFTFAEDKAKLKAKKTSYRPTADSTTTSKPASNNTTTGQPKKPVPTTKATQEAKANAAKAKAATATQTATPKPEPKKPTPKPTEAPKPKEEVKITHAAPDEKSEHDFAFDKEVDDIIAKIKREVEEQAMQEEAAPEATEEKVAAATKESFDVSEDELVGDVEDKAPNVAMISDGTDDEDVDDDGFEFI